MKQELRIEKTLMAIAVAAGFGLLAAGSARAQFDTTGDPVIPEVKSALEKGDVTSILKWVKKDNEAEIKVAFAKAVAVRAKGPMAKELADQYFLETLVRLRRSDESAPNTGIKDKPVKLIVAMADKALEAKNNKDKSVEADRKFVETDVTYIHYVEGIQTAIASAVGHHHAESAEAKPSAKNTASDTDPKRVP